MDNKSSRMTYGALTYLIACVLEGVTPDRTLLAGTSPEQVYKCALKHSLDSLACVAFESLGIVNSGAVENKNLAVRKAVLLDAEREHILSELERRGIRYMPLKGIYMKDYYPGIGLRQMADNDILFDTARREEVRDFMVARGYDVTFGGTNHDAYVRPPVYNFEMHVSLMSTTDHILAVEYYSDGFAKGVPIPGTSYGYRMKNEDFYIYLKAHEYKHHISGGIGLRALVDVFLFLRAEGESLDMNYIAAELNKLGICDYEEKTRGLAFKLFSPESCAAVLTDTDESALSEEEYLLFDGFCYQGAYGNMETYTKNHMERAVGKGGFFSNLKFFFSRLFPPLSWYERYKPFYYKHKYLIPFFVIYRIFFHIFRFPKRTVLYIKNIFKSKEAKKEQNEK